MTKRHGGALRLMFISLLIPFAAACGGDDDSGNSTTNPNDADNDGFTVEAGDCNDANPWMKPGAVDIPGDGIDQDCSGEDAPNPLDVDDDGDGISENEGDCRDTDKSIFPGATDLCGDGIDQDCSGADAECSAVDGDEDGFTPAQGDCDDTDASVSPREDEVPYNGKDDDCDPETVDDDVDGDGFSKIGGGDCDDDTATTFPGADEIPYDGIDQDCSGSDLADVDGDGYAGGTDGEDCDDLNPMARPNGVDVCDDGIDQDCSGADLVCDDLDRDNDGFSTNDGDCNDDDDTIGPGIAEVAYDGIDNDCDTATKDDDLDGDGFTKNGGGDCDDDVATIFPGAQETPYDGIDQDCSGADLIDLDNDGFAGGVNGTDCDDTRPDIHPDMTEIPYDGVDQNCDAFDTIGSDAFEFTLGQGNKFEIATAWNGQVHLVVWAEYRNGSQRVFGSTFDASGTQIGGEFQVGAGGQQPAVASDGSNFLVAYRTNTEFSAQRVSGAGALVGSAITLSSHSMAPFQARPSVAYGAGKYVVAVQDNSGCTGPFASDGVWTAFTVATDGTVATGGRIMDANVGCNDTFGVGSPALASNGANFLAGWFASNEVKGRVIAADGSTSGQEFTIHSTSSNDRRVALASDGTDYLVVFQDYVGEYNLSANLVTANGVPGTSFVVSSAPGAQTDARVAFVDGEYFVSFVDERWNFWSVYGQTISTSGALMGTAANVNVGLLADGSNYSNRNTLATDGTNLMILWGSQADGGVILGRSLTP